MIRFVVVAAIALAFAQPAHARHRHARGYVPWCGLYMMKLKGKHEARLAQARQWAREGTNAGGPAVGAVVVWPHHVGEIRGGPDRRGLYLIHSGNDGNAVRTRWRSIRGAIAFRFI
jgi:hypothetical protein